MIIKHEYCRLRKNLEGPQKHECSGAERAQRLLRKRLQTKPGTRLLTKTADEAGTQAVAGGLGLISSSGFVRSLFK